MEQPKPVRIDPKLMNEVESYQPSYYKQTTTWVNHLVRVGLNIHLGLDPCDILGKPNETERKKEKREVLPNTYSSNNINKEKIKKWKFDINALPEGHGFYKDLKHLIADFWRVKKGSRSEAAYKQLIGENGIGGIYNKYGEAAVKEQLETAIASEWQSITLKNYEAFGRPKNSVKEPADNHPAGKVFTASDIYGEV